MGFQHEYDVNTLILSGTLFVSKFMPYNIMKKYNIIRFNTDIRKLQTSTDYIKYRNDPSTGLFYVYNPSVNDGRYYLHIIVDVVHKKIRCCLPGEWSCGDKKTSCFTIEELNITKPIPFKFPEKIEPIWDVASIVDVENFNEKILNLLENKSKTTMYLVQFCENDEITSPSLDFRNYSEREISDDSSTYESEDDDVLIEDIKTQMHMSESQLPLIRQNIL